MPTGRLTPHLFGASAPSTAYELASLHASPGLRFVPRNEGTALILYAGAWFLGLLVLMLQHDSQGRVVAAGEGRSTRSLEVRSLPPSLACLSVPRARRDESRECRARHLLAKIADPPSAAAGNGGSSGSVAADGGMALYVGVSVRRWHGLDAPATLPDCTAGGEQ